MPVTMSRFIDTHSPVSPIRVSSTPPMMSEKGLMVMAHTAPTTRPMVDMLSTAAKAVCTVRARISEPGLSNENRNMAGVSPSRSTIWASVIEAMINSTDPNWARVTWLR